MAIFIVPYMGWVHILLTIRSRYGWLELFKVGAQSRSFLSHQIQGSPWFSYTHMGCGCSDDVCIGLGALCWLEHVVGGDGAIHSIHVELLVIVDPSHRAAIQRALRHSFEMRSIHFCSLCLAWVWWLCRGGWHGSVQCNLWKALLDYKRRWCWVCLTCFCFAHCINCDSLSLEMLLENMLDLFLFLEFGILWSQRLALLK